MSSSKKLDEGTYVVPRGTKLDFPGSEKLKIREMTPTFRAVCVVLNELTERLSAFEKHEPDLRLEERFNTKEAKFVTFATDDGQPIAHVRFCKRCRLMYVEDVE